MLVEPIEGSDEYVDLGQNNVEQSPRAVLHGSICLLTLVLSKVVRMIQMERKYSPQKSLINSEEKNSDKVKFDFV